MIDDLKNKIFSISNLKGNFTLRSGQVSNEYFDKYLFESDPEILDQIASELIKIIPPETEVLAGLEMGGIPIATALSIKSKIPTAFVRKEAKKYGTAKLAEGADIQGKNVCIVEDVVTTGGQVLLSAKDLTDRGANIVGVLCVIERGDIGRKNIEGNNLKFISLFNFS
jgi:orotate phosphoribosyltransferase